MPGMNKEDIEKFVGQIVETVMGKTVAELKHQQTENMKVIMSMKQAGITANQDKGLDLARFIKSVAATRGSQSDSITYAKKMYGEDSEVVKALSASQFSAGGAFVPTDFVDEIIELLRPASIIRRLNPTSVDMPNGNLTLPKLTGGATANYISENDDIPKSQQTTGDLKLTFKKLVALVPISNDLLRFGTARSDTMIRDDIISSIATREDIAFIRGDGTQDTPKGLRYWAPAANLIAANSTVNLANVTVDLGKLVLQLENANVRMLRPAWMMAPRSKNYLMTVRDGNGNYAFRDEMLTGTLWGFPFATSTQIPTNLGGGTDESEIYFVDMADAIIGEAQGMIVDASTEASYKDGANLVSAYSKDQTIIRAISEHDFGMRHDASVAILTAVKWI